MKPKLVALMVLIGVIAVTIVAVLAGDLPSPTTNHHNRSIALLYIEGIIESGRGSTSWTGSSLGSDTVCQVLEEIRRDPNTDAVVVRLNSPGGSAAGSREIAEALSGLRQDGIVVVVSMADVAASGAYWIAVAADEIVADPATITGSIGVIMQLQNIEELYEKIGITVETFKSGEHKDIGSPNRQPTDTERHILQAIIDDVYEQFVEAVVANRDMTEQAVRDAADGRIFTGRQAKELGLVDTLGGLQTALDRAADLAGLDAYSVYEVERPVWWEWLLTYRTSSSGWGAWDYFRQLLVVPWMQQTQGGAL